jgi:hypothetical protein
LHHVTSVENIPLSSFSEESLMAFLISS